jgi:hypothetical protein
MTIITEAAALAPEALTGASWKVRILEGERQGSSAYYPAKALEEGRTLFTKGTRVFLNHRAEGEPPSRDAEKIIGWFTEDAEFDGKDLHGTVHIREDKQKLIKELAEGGVIGMSISAEGKFKPGTKILEAFTKVHSVDVVSVPGAGGGFTQMLEAESASDGTAVPGSQKEESHMDAKELAAALAEALAPKFAELAEAVKPAAPAAKPLEESKADEKAPLGDFIKALDESELTAPAKAIVTAVYENGGDFAAAIEAEKTREAAILEAKGTSFKGAVVTEASTEASLNEAVASIFGGKR